MTTPSDQTDSKFSTLNQQDVEHGYALSRLLSDAIFSRRFSIPSSIDDAISLTTYGEKWHKYLLKHIEHLPSADAKLMLFMVFFHNELFIDIEKTNLITIQELINTSILSNDLRYPWLFDSVLYNKYHEIRTTHTNAIPGDETISLLDGSKQGVFQVANFLVGPYGLVSSNEKRLIPPTKEMINWQCNDIKCQNRHSVYLSSETSKISRVTQFITTEIFIQEGPKVLHESDFLTWVNSAHYYENMRIDNIPLLICDCLSETETRDLLNFCLSENIGGIRQVISKHNTRKALLSKNAVDLVNKLPKAECIQTLLQLKDSQLAVSLEQLIDSGKVDFPPTERRAPRITIPSGFFRMTCETSRLGVRAISSNKNIAFSRLRDLIIQIYSGDQIAMLDWRLRYVEGNTTIERLDNYCHYEDPKEIIKNLIIDSKPALEFCFSYLKVGNFFVPTTSEEETSLTKRILWKLGFAVYEYPSYQESYWRRLEKLKSVASSCHIVSESERETIRSASVNLFVSLEEILDASLTFCVWFLLSDHYSQTDFKFNLASSREFMAQQLNSAQQGKNEPIHFEGCDKNTLFPLIQGYRLLAEICKDLLSSKSKTVHKRRKEEFPAFHSKTTIQPFPFSHNKLALDLRQSDIELMISTFNETTHRLNKAEIGSIRNRLGHKRTDFPSKEEIINACKELEVVVGNLELLGLVPAVHYKSHQTIDEYGRGKVYFKDFRDDEVILVTPSKFSNCRIPPLNLPMIIVKCARIGDSNEYIRFSFEESSEYTSLRNREPKRKLLNNESTE